MESSNGSLFAFWAKYSNNADSYHPLLYHCLDTGNVALKLLESGFARDLINHIRISTNLSLEGAICFLALLISFHDIGKGVPAFQNKIPGHCQILQKSGIEMPPAAGRGEILHGTATYYIVKEYLQQQFGEQYTNTPNALAAHHGQFVTLGKPPSQLELGNQTWQQNRNAIIDTLVNHFFPGLNSPHLQSLESEDPGNYIVFTGLVTICDWLASNEEFFPHGSDISWDDYPLLSEERANEAVAKTGWSPAIASPQKAEFAELFPFKPNELQQSALDLLQSSSFPAIYIIEARMGQGKTETALTIADHSFSSGRQKGFYIALPTTATSNAMHRRIKNDYLGRRFPDHADARLIHGSAFLQKLNEEIKTYGDQKTSSSLDSSDTVDWFAPKKRCLLSPFGVGTIDQSFLSVLQTKHWFVRLFGLAGKIVIFDEVHAYDTYMSTILERLLAWLKAVGSSVIILSATLPQQKLSALLKAYSGNSLAPEKISPYPRITVADPDGLRCLPVPFTSPTTEVAVNFINDDLEIVASSALKEINSGGCLAVIVNTVNRAQELYQTLARLKTDDVSLIIFHARTPFIWRQQREEEVLRLFGKPDKSTGITPDRPRKAILVATQVVEQSLDLDFDIIYTDIAPVDLILQRIGRMHRHQRRDRNQHFPQPACTIIRPENIFENENISNARVYDPYIVLKSWVALKDLSNIIMPQQIDQLVQRVYQEGIPQQISEDESLKMSDLQNASKTDQQKDKLLAKNILVSKPFPPEDLVNTNNQGLNDDENDPEVRKSFRAATRLGDPGIQVVCLEQLSDGTLAALDGTAIDLENKPGLKQLQAILQSALTISNKTLYRQLVAECTVSAWKSIKSIRHHRCLIFTDNCNETGNFKLLINYQTGLAINKKEE